MEIGGTFRQLFAIRDRGAEGPLIYFRSGDTLDDAINGDVDIGDTHLSFHPSKGARSAHACTLSYTTATTTGQISDGKAHFKFASPNDAWLFCSIRAPHMMPDKYASKPKPSDTVVRLARFAEHPHFSLCYYLVAAHPEVSETTVALNGMRYHIMRYPDVAIIIFYDFMMTLPLPNSSIIISLTSTPRVNRAEAPSDIQIENVKPNKIQRITRPIYLQKQHLCAHTIGKLQETMTRLEVPGAAEMLEFLHPHVHKFVSTCPGELAT